MPDEYAPRSKIPRMRYWLFKSEPESYGIDDLERDGRTPWSGVRNYQARNFMREMRLNDLAFFYHSSVTPAGIAGLCRVVCEIHPDTTAIDPASPYFDPKSCPEKPIWEMVEVAFERRFEQLLTLDRLRRETALVDMPLLRKGQRLSVQPVTAAQWTSILALGG